MIQLSLVGTKGTDNTSSPGASKQKGGTTAFAELLKQPDDTDEKQPEMVNPMGQVLQMLQGMNPLVQPILPSNNISTNPNLNVISEQVPTIQNMKLQDDVHTQLNLLEGISNNLQAQVYEGNLPKGLKTLQEEVDQRPKLTKGVPASININEDVNKTLTSKTADKPSQSLKPVDVFQISPNLLVKKQIHEDKAEPIQHGEKQDSISSTQQPVLPFNDTSKVTAANDTNNIAQPVRADHLLKDVSMVLQNAKHGQTIEKGVEATFSLHPEHLGKVDVKVSIKEGNVTAEFFTNTTNGKDLLEANIQSLRTALEHQGFQVDKIDISQQSNFTGSFAQKGDSQPRQYEQRKRNGQSFLNQEDGYGDSYSELESVSLINTTA